MAGGLVRYARYIAVAAFTLILSCIFLNSDHSRVIIQSPVTYREPGETSALNPSRNHVDGSRSYDVPPVAGTTDGLAEISTQKKPTLEADSAEYPLVVEPGEPGWDDNMLSPAPGPRMNATFVSLARNSDLWDIARSIRQVEDRFNRRYHYDWVFFNDQPFDEEFKKVTSSLVSGRTYYSQVPFEHWSFPPWIDQARAQKAREDMGERNIIYGDSISYRHMCRFESGFFFREPLMMNYEWYWRVEPSIEFHCDLHYDPFRFMAERGKKYSFVISMLEFGETIETLWHSTKKFMQNFPQHISPSNTMPFVSEDGGESYNNCHFWSNFEIGSLEWLRSEAYIDYFESLDQDGGFFYERWGDAPVHSIAASLMLNSSEIHFFDDIAYTHPPFTHCPTSAETRLQLRCHCDPGSNFDWKGSSCLSRFFDVNQMTRPTGWEEQQG